MASETETIARWAKRNNVLLSTQVIADNFRLSSVETEYVLRTLRTSPRYDVTVVNGKVRVDRLIERCTVSLTNEETEALLARQEAGELTATLAAEIGMKPAGLTNRLWRYKKNKQIRERELKARQREARKAELWGVALGRRPI